MAVIEKYIRFKDHPLFLPMISPTEMLEHGIHEGTLMDKTPALEHNYYKCLEEVPPFATKVKDQVIHSLMWFEWYMSMYRGERNPELDRVMIQWWAQVCNWGTNVAKGSSAVDQMLLHYAWAPGWPWKGNLEHYQK